MKKRRKGPGESIIIEKARRYRICDNTMAVDPKNWTMC